ncbi:MAG: DUF3037 domain-containing protein [Pedobacter sp.]|nr:MAG: DUF3037 domain-containing protein [Pedobacter sp.]
MQEKSLFEYAIIRLVPRVEREEFINVGVILYCAKQKFLKAKVILQKSRLDSFSEDVDIDFVLHNLNAIVQICDGVEGSGVIGQLDQPSRFRWLTATRSTIIQSSKVHPGFCKDPNEAIKRLLDEFVN